MGTLVSQGSGFVGGFLASIWSGRAGVFSVLSLLVIAPVVAFYLLLDWDRVLVTVDWLDSAAAPQHRARARPRHR